MDFTNNPLSYDLSELIGEHEIKELAHQVEKVRKDLYLYKTIEWKHDKNSKKIWKGEARSCIRKQIL